MKCLKYIKLSKNKRRIKILSKKEIWKIQINIIGQQQKN